MKVAEQIILSSEERGTLESWSNGRSLPFRIVQRAQIICMAADGILSQTIARQLHISRPTVQLWRQRFLALRISGLEKNAPRPGRIPRISHRKVMAVVNAVHRIWKQHNLKPHLVETFKLSRDKKNPTRVIQKYS